MRNIDLESLQIFKAVVDFGGITKAADQLHRVQSNIPTRVQNLEERLGVKLFQRQNGRLVLSSEGRVLLGYAERLLRLSSEAESALRSGVPRGTLRLGSMESTAAAHLPLILSDYHQNYPEVQIELITGTSGALISKVHRFDIEAAFVAEPFSPEGLESQEAFVEELVLITSQSKTAIKSPKDLKKSTVIAFGTGCTYRRVLEDWLSNFGVIPDCIMEMGSYHAIVACVAAGSGIAIIPRSVLSVVQTGRKVTTVALPTRFARAKTCLVWRKGHESMALNAMREGLNQKK